jgi:hypothetical protein
MIYGLYNLQMELQDRHSLYGQFVASEISYVLPMNTPGMLLVGHRYLNDGSQKTLTPCNSSFGLYVV